MPEGDVCDLMGEQMQSGRGVGAILAVSERDVRAERECARADAADCVIRARSGMDANRGNIAAEPPRKACMHVFR